MELLLETRLSQKPNVELNDTTALTKEQQDRLNQHKVLLVNCILLASSTRCTGTH